MTNEVDLILNQVESLSGKISDKEKLTLIQRIAEVLQGKSQSQTANAGDANSLKYGEFRANENKGLVYGKYKDYPGPMSTEEDFKAAEYHFNEDEWK